ncbi:hypothetical protein [Streptomyces sp. NPDC003023]|uniref:hypothetical protein n=1 Tax=Streptomyces sp. NPDC003023 TaxID=3364675 RepID=UPI00369DD711
MQVADAVDLSLGADTTDGAETRVQMDDRDVAGLALEHRLPSADVEDVTSDAQEQARQYVEAELPSCELPSYEVPAAPEAQLPSVDAPAVDADAGIDCLLGPLSAFAHELQQVPSGA